MVEVSTKWRINMQTWGQWGLVRIFLGVHLELLDLWSKSVGESIAIETSVRLRWTCMWHRPKKR